MKTCAVLSPCGSQGGLLSRCHPGGRPRVLWCRAYQSELFVSFTSITSQPSGLQAWEMYLTACQVIFVNYDVRRLVYIWISPGEESLFGCNCRRIFNHWIINCWRTEEPLDVYG